MEILRPCLTGAPIKLYILIYKESAPKTGRTLGICQGTRDPPSPRDQPSNDLRFGPPRIETWRNEKQTPRSRVPTCWFGDVRKCWELLHTLGGRLGGSQPTGPVKNVWVSSVVLGHAETKIWVDAFVCLVFCVFFQIWGGGSKVKMMSILKWELGVYPNPMLP